MKNENNVITGFLQCLGVEALNSIACSTGEITFYNNIVIIKGSFGFETKIYKTPFDDAIIYTGMFDLEHARIDKDEIFRRYTAAKHRRDDAIGKKREKEMEDKYKGACLAIKMAYEL